MSKEEILGLLGEIAIQIRPVFDNTPGVDTDDADRALDRLADVLESVIERES